MRPVTIWNADVYGKCVAAKKIQKMTKTRIECMYICIWTGFDN